jgi:hypothetical protein
MPRWKTCSLVLVCLVLSVSALAQNRPQSFGVDDYTVTTISATSFTPVSDSMPYGTSGSLGRFSGINTLGEFYVGVNLPGGAVIDYIGLNSLNDTDGVFTADLAHRDSAGGVTIIGTATSTLHATWATDFNPTALNSTWNGQSGEALVVKVTGQSNPNLQFFGWVEIWWKRSVSPSPATATFGDVPTDHIFFQFIEALAASGITGGCGAGNYCPDSPVTRGQMATFLAKALGLHFPGATAPPVPPTAHE